MIDGHIIRSIHREYLSLIEDHYGAERSRFETSGLRLDEFLDVEAFGSSDLSIAKGSRALSSSEYKAVAFQEGLRAFWARHWSSLKTAVGTDTGLSVCVWGDMEIEALVRRYAVYFDTIFIPDPIATYARHDSDQPSPALYSKQYFIWTLIVLGLKELLVADSDPIPIVLYPQRFSIGDSLEDEEKRVQDLKQVSELTTYHYMSQTLSLEGKDPTVMSLFEKALSTDLKLLGRRIESSNLPTFLGEMLENLNLFPTLTVKGYDGLANRIRSGKVTRRDLQRIFVAVRSQFYTLEAREENARTLFSDNALSKLLWIATKEKNTMLAERFNSQLERSEPGIVAASFEENFQWLDNLSDEEVVHLRSDKRLGELRRLFEVDRRMLKTATTDDFAKVAKEYETAVVSRLEAFSGELINKTNELRRKRNIGVALFGVSTGLGVASLALPTLAILSALSFAYSVVVGGPSVLDFYRNARKKETEPLERPVTLLLEAHGRHAP